MPCTTRSGGVHDCRTALSVEGVTPQHWRVTFDHRPIKVNRVVPDDEADRIARRIASFDKQTIAETKGFVAPRRTAAGAHRVLRPRGSPCDPGPDGAPGLPRSRARQRARAPTLRAHPGRDPMTPQHDPTDVQGVDP